MPEPRRNHQDHDSRVVLLHVQNAFVPQRVIDRLSQMILDKRVGYVRFQLRNGKIVGTHIEEVFTTS